jgi:hypothetical protein
MPASKAFAIIFTQSFNNIRAVPGNNSTMFLKIKNNTTAAATTGYGRFSMQTPKNLVERHTETIPQFIIRRSPLPIILFIVKIQKFNTRFDSSCHTTLALGFISRIQKCKDTTFEKAIILPSSKPIQALSL